jgi:glycosyltransferase involved in cell wall biosynthesis
MPASPHRINVLEVIGNAIVGGMETYVTRLLEHLPPDRFRVIALCPFESQFTDELRELNVEVLVTAMPDDPPWSSIHLGCTLVKTQAIDVIHAHLSNAHLLAGLIGRITGKPVLGTIHGRQLSTLDVEVHRATGTHLSVVCKQTYFHAIGLGIHPSQLHCIPNGVDTDRFTPSAQRPTFLRTQWGVPPDAPLVGFIGRLSPEKGPEVFLRAARNLQCLAPETRFVMVGEGPMRAELSRFIDQFGLHEQVRLVGLHSNMQEVYAELDLVVSTSHTEAMPFALMEAMACGLPVIGTRVGGVPDLIQHGQTGWLVTPGADQEAAQRVANLIASPADRQRMGQLGRARCVERFSMASCCAATLSLFQRLAPVRGDQRRIGPVVSTAKLTRGEANPA